jgi:hypothetical protein
LATKAPGDAADAAATDAVHTAQMPRCRTWRWLVPGVALLAVVGVWLSHTLEYVRVWGWSGLNQELTGSVHVYMVPVGLALVLLMVAAGAGAASSSAMIPSHGATETAEAAPTA